MAALRAHDEALRALAGLILAMALLAVVARKLRTRRREERIAEPMDATELRRKRLAMLGPQVCVFSTRQYGPLRVQMIDEGCVLHCSTEIKRISTSSIVEKKSDFAKFSPCL